MKFLYINFVVSLWVTAIATLAIGFFVLVRNLKSTVNRTFAFYSFAITWWSFCQIWLIACDKRLTALIWTRIEQVGVFFIPTFFVHFVISLLNIKKRNGFLAFCYSLSVIFAFLCATPLMMADAIPKETVKYVKYFATPGLAYHFAILFFVFTILRGLNWLYKGYRSSSGAKKNQLRYLFWSSLFGYFGGAANFLLVYGISIPLLNPFGTYALPIYIMVVAYSIVRFRLMDINVALTRAGVFIGVYLLVLGIPFWIGFKYLGQGPWILPVSIMAVFASIGPFIYIFLQRRAEDALLKERRRYQETINNLSESMLDIREIDKLLATITSTIADAIKIKFATIYLKEDQYKSFQLKSCYPQEEKSRFEELIPLDDSLIGILNQRKKPSLSEEIGQQERISLDSGVVIPCFGKDGLIGFIILGAKQNNQMYTSDDLLVLETFSYNTSLAIENCTYWKEFEDRHRKARLQEMDSFAYSLAHEINNPMNIVRELSAFLKNHFLKYITDAEERQEVEETCGVLIECSNRVMSMVKAIREFGQKSTGESVLLNLQEVIEGFCKLYMPELKANFILLEKEMPQEPITVKGVAAEIQQILMIFAKNAIHAMTYSKEKKITLKVTRVNHNTVRIAFSDTGYGIKKENIQTIFSPFFTTKASTEGTGMGLHNAKGFVLRHQGRMWAESEGEGKGSSFIVELPIIAEDAKLTPPKQKEGTQWAF